MSKLDMNSTPTRRAFKNEIDKLYGDDVFTRQQARDALVSCGEPANKWHAIYEYVLRRHCQVGRGLYSFGSGTAPQNKVEKSVTTKQVLKDDWKVLTEDTSDTEAVAKKWEDKARKAKQSFEKPKVVKNNIIELIPVKDPAYVSWGHFKDISTILRG